MEHNVAQPEPEAFNVATLPPVDVPQTEWHLHPILQRARLNIVGDGIEWPNATFEQLPMLRQITLVVDDGVLCARLAAQFNFDRFVDAHTHENGPAQPFGHAEDIQRFYTRVTENGFHVVGVFCASTVSGRRRYFQWLTGAWVEIGLSGFLYVRDDLDTHFSEVSAAQLDGQQPGASATSVTIEEQWTTETVQNQFVGEPMMENYVDTAHAQHLAPAPQPVAETAPQPVAETAPQPVSEPAPVPKSATTSQPDAAPVDTNAAVQRGIAIAIASVVHRNSLDFAGAAVIDHVARVAESFDASHDTIRHCAAWLHDVLDVGTISQSDLLDAGVLPEIVDIVSILTRPSAADEASWLDAISGKPDARAVKLRAIADNSAGWRLRRLDVQTRAQVEAACARASVRLHEVPES